MSYVNKAMDVSKKSISDFVITVSLLLLVCKVPITCNHCYIYILLKNNVVPAVQWHCDSAH